MTEPLPEESASIDLRRLVLQTLESWSAAGVTHLPAVSVQAFADVGAPIAAPARSAPVAKTPNATTPDPSIELNDPMPKPTPPARKAATSLPTDTPGIQKSLLESKSEATIAKQTALTTPPKVLSLEQRVVELKVLSERVSQCVRCQELAETRTQTVFGVGNPQARLVFIGEAPGADEDEQGEPFVGRAGKLLNDIIKAMQLTREEIYICNVLRCRPPGNRLPAPTEAANCREYLDGQLEIINPEFIVCWGSCAAQNLLSSVETIGKLRGRWFEYNGAKVRCTYHPSYLLRNPAAKKDVWEDMKVVMKELGIPVP